MRQVVWFRGKDLRVADHGPLAQAAADGEVLPIFVAEPRYFGPGRPARAPHRTQYLLQSLDALQSRLSELGSQLLVLEGPASAALPAFCARWAVDAVLAYRTAGPEGRRREKDLAAALRVPLRLFDGETLLPPGSLRTLAGRPYAVFSQFARAFTAHAVVPRPAGSPRRLPPVPAAIRGSKRTSIAALASLGLQPNPAVIEGGEHNARRRLDRFVSGEGHRYDSLRDHMGLAATSRLSADLKFGALSVRQVWSAASAALGDSDAWDAFRNELLWREFTHSTLWDRPELLRTPFRPGFADFPWVDDEAAWDAWTEGRTGYPIVDAAARQLRHEGFVHNRARMVSASFLTKHLLIGYRRGEAHYMRWLVDGDPAQNNAGWQWSAGCGCDAQPYFRVFNPVLQGQRFDPDGDYVRRWLPALGRMPPSHIHRPWQAPATVLREAHVQLGRDYPAPIVDHRMARERFLSLARTHLRRG